MKTRKEFLEAFFTKLMQGGFRVEPITETDLAAEVYADSTLFCVITKDGEIIYESYNTDKARALEQLVQDTKTAQGCCTQPPFADMERMETVNLIGGSYVKVFESAGMVLLCRQTGLFGYEFVTCQKASSKHNHRQFYREQLFYDPAEAQNSFMERSGLTLPNPLNFTHEELRILVSCCARAVMLDNELDSDTENRINGLMAKMEQYLPQQQELSPRHYFQNEIGV